MDNRCALPRGALVKILVYGAGVLGSLYAAKLAESENDVTILARGQRLIEIRANGIALEDLATRQQTTTHVSVVGQLAPRDAYELIIVLMRKNQVSVILPILAANDVTTHILFMHNNAAGFNEIVQSLGRGRASIGFPGAGGTLDGGVVRCGLIPQQPTTLGELDGGVTVRLKQIESVFEKAGFPTVISRQMDGWLKTHVAFITAVAGALYMVDCDNYALAKKPDGVPLMARGVREGFRVLRKLGVTVTPLKLRVLFEWLPFSVPVAYWRNYLNSSMRLLPGKTYQSGERGDSRTGR
jgi:2-dehydropantoate 2-reductase